MSDTTTRSIIVQGTAEDVYRLWADFESFPKFMKHIKSVTRTGEKSSHWVMSGPLGRTLEWDADTTRLEEGKRIAWNSREGSSVRTSGQVTFNQLANDQTEVTVTIHYVPPAGKAGEILMEVFANPEHRLEEDLRNFKAHAEGMTERITR
jgi:uncharacterized membrane protein